MLVREDTNASEKNEGLGVIHEDCLKGPVFLFLIGLFVMVRHALFDTVVN